MEIELISFVLAPIGLGFLGFIEPCSMGTNLIFLKYVENKPSFEKLSTTLTFTITRAITIGALGGIAAYWGAAFITAQQVFWIILGSIYFLLGGIYLSGKKNILKRHIGVGMARLSDTRGTVTLGLLFAFNIPACAAPLLFVLFGTATSADTIGRGIMTMMLFGLSLSLPLVFAAHNRFLRNRMEQLSKQSSRLPLWTGGIFILLGVWSIYFGLFVNLENWASGV